jgi:hypothetical protein
MAGAIATFVKVQSERTQPLFDDQNRAQACPLIKLP